MRKYLLASDFDQTLSFNDSGIVLSELLGIPGFEARVAQIAESRLVQQGAELAYLLLHDPEYRRVRREDLVATGERIRVKPNVQHLLRLLDAIGGHRFAFYVISAAPETVIRAALAGIVPEDHIHGTRFDYDEASGAIRAIRRVPAGYGKVVVLDELRRQLALGPDRVIYVGDGSSDVHVMLHVNRLGGETIAVSENRYLTPIAKRTVLSDDGLSVLVPILEDLVGLSPARVREFFEGHGFVLQDWDKSRTDTLTILGTGEPRLAVLAS